MQLRRGLLIGYFVALFLITWGATGAAWGRPLPSGSYEERLTKWGLAQSGRTLATAPAGRRIEEIVVVSEDVVADADPWPRVANSLHFKTKPQVILAELLLHPGETYDVAKAEESERNLRRLSVIAMARVLPVEGRAGGVALLVVTKDLWSIRFRSDYLLVGTLLERLRVRPTEQNLFGLNIQLSLDFALRLDTLSFGQSMAAYRFLGAPLQVAESAVIIFNRQTGRAEGTRGGLSVGRPLYSLSDRWSYGVAGAWDLERARIFRGASVWQLPFPTEAAPTARIPYIYDARELSGSALLTRSFGYQVKTDVSGGVGAYARRYRPPTEAQLSPEQQAFLYAGYLPRNEVASYLTASVHTYQARYQVMHNLETFVLSEDAQLGYSAVATVRWADPAFFSPQRFVEGSAAVRYTFLVGQNLTLLYAAGTTRWQTGAEGRGEGGPWVNRRFAAQLVNYTPLIGPGRFAVRLLLDVKRFDLNHVPLFLGGDTGLRGLAPQALTGTRMVLGNFEYRTLPVELFTVHGGLVLFWDAGSTVTTGAFRLVHTVGIGLRLLLPQLDVVPVRIDFGYVVNGVPPPWPDRLSSTLGQVFDATPTFLTAP